MRAYKIVTSVILAACLFAGCGKKDDFDIEKVNEQLKTELKEKETETEAESEEDKTENDTLYTEKGYSNTIQDIITDEPVCINEDLKGVDLTQYIRLNVDYKDITIEEQRSPVDLSRERGLYLKWILENPNVCKKTEGRVERDQDVSIDYEAVVEGTVIKSETDRLIFTHNSQFIQEVINTIIGKHTGDTFTVTTDASHFDRQKYTTEKAEVTVKINYICKQQDLTDSFAEQISGGRCLSAEELPDFIARKMEDRMINPIVTNMGDLVIRKINQTIEFTDFPEKALKAEEDKLAKRNGYDSYDSSPEEYKKNCEAAAKKYLTQDMEIQYFINEFNINITKDDLMRYYDINNKTMWTKPVEEYITNFSKEELQRNIAIMKIYDALISKVRITTS